MSRVIALGEFSRLAGVLCAGLMVFGLSACATAPQDPEERAEYEQTNDPLEPLNRAVFDVNMVLDGLFLRPAAVVYSEALPQPVQNGVNNFLTNLRSPIVFANDVLQGEVDRAGTTAGRFLVNSTIGVLGVFDVAEDLGMAGHSEDFGQTFAVWGMNEGFYLVLPVLGPSNPRDAAGLAVEWYVDPVNRYLRGTDRHGWIIVRSLVTGIDYRARNLETLDELQRTSLDYYAAIRSLYRQRRAAEISNNKSGADEPAPAVSDGGVGGSSSDSH